MGKADQQRTQANITDKVNQDNNSTNTGIADTQSRLSDATRTAQSQLPGIWNGYQSLATNPGSGGAIDQSAADRLLSGNYTGVAAPSTSTGGNATGTSLSSGGGGGGSNISNASSQSPTYLDTFNELREKNAGYDPTRLGNINNATSSLYDTSGNYGDVNANIDKLSTAEKNYGATNNAVSGLSSFAKSGGLSADQLGNINRSSLTNIENTGGYSAADIANARARGNAGISSTYGNLQDTLQRQKMSTGQLGPGWSDAGFKLARQGAQATADQSQKTEADIHDRVVGNQLAAGSKLGDLGLGTAQLQSSNTLSGYNSAGQLDIAKNQAIQDAWNKAGTLGLGRQAQIDAAKEAAAAIDNQTQGIQNQTRLGAATGQSQDTIGRMQVGVGAAGVAASALAAQNALNATNQRFLISEGDANRNTGLGGMLNTYTANPSNVQFNQNLLRGYGQDQSTNSQQAITDRTNAANIPGLSNTIGGWLGVGSQAAGMLSGGLSGFAGMGSSPTSTGFNPSTPGSPMLGYGQSGLWNPYTTNSQNASAAPSNPSMYPSMASYPSYYGG